MVFHIRARLRKIAAPLRLLIILLILFARCSVQTQFFFNSTFFSRFPPRLRIMKPSRCDNNGEQRGGGWLIKYRLPTGVTE